MPKRWLLPLPMLVGLLLASATFGQTGNDAGLALFEAKIRPVLVKHCYECHSAAGGKTESGLALDTRDGSRRGGDRGPAVVPGDPKASVLLDAIVHADPDLKMPPKQPRLPDAVVADFRKWIELGAPDPRNETKPARRLALDLASARGFWSYKKPVDHPPPPVKDPAWPRRNLDHFVLDKLEAASLSPSGDADEATFIRRLYFDLLGLPPSSKTSVDLRVDDAAPSTGLKGQGPDGWPTWEKNLETVVDLLLASPRFGERWGRHWLDVARFAESSGKEANISFPYAWRYRDYVIDAVNDDVPFNRFIQEQVAGDLLPYENDKERARLLIATGFLALGPKNLDEGNAVQFYADLIDEQIDTVTRAVMATSVACARCHDHKFEPYSVEDYYSLAGVFASTQTYFGTFVSPANRMGGDPLVLPKAANQPILHASIPATKVRELKEKLAALKAEKPDNLRDALRVFWATGSTEGQLEKVDDEGNALPLAMGVLDREQPIDVPLLERGEVSRVGKTMPRRFPPVIELDCAQPPADSSGRLELAQWLTHPDHPLTARVIVNRVWRQLFGSGIVATVDNFGPTGELPSHPELLDHLAVRFMQEGWSIKKLVREIVLSRTYRQASTFRQAAFEADSDNRLLWRMSKRRLEAEAIRDSMLAASGELDTTRPVGSLVGRKIGDKPISLIGLDRSLPSDLDDSLHRSVYLPVLRDRLPDVLDVFDFAEPSLVTGERETTNVPVQALYLMNSPFVMARAKAFAERVCRETDDGEDRIQRAFLYCFSRKPRPEEIESAKALLTKEHGPEAWTALCQALFATAEFRNLD